MNNSSRVNNSSPISLQVQKQAKYLQANRTLVKRILNDTNRVAGGNPELRSLANTFSRYAQTQQTAYETGVAASSTGTTSVMERTVEHAIASVLGRSPGNDGALGSALQDVFPTLGSGRVATDPARSIVSPMGSDGPSFAGAASAAGLSGQISAEQAALYRQASVIIPDARRVVAGIMPFAVVEQMDAIESLRGLIDQALATLLVEFGRVDEPRSALVNDYLGKLRGRTGFVSQFGELARVNGAATPDMYSDEQQIASYKLVLTYVEQLATAWNAYVGRSGNAFGIYPLFTERLQRAGSMLGVIAQANINFMSAMDSVGFSEAERRSSTSRFEFLNPAASLSNIASGEQRLNDLVAGILHFSTMTVYDYTEWVDKLSRADGPRLLTDGGQAGLQFVTGQADTLFLTIAPVLYFAKANSDADLTSRPIVAQVLAHERVTWAMSDLFNQLDVLADLAA